MLRYRYGVLPVSVTALPTEDRRPRVNQESYARLPAEELNRFKKAPVLRTEVIDTLFFDAHIPSFKMLLALNRYAINPEQFHKVYAFNRACDFIRNKKIELFNARMKALQFHYSRFQYHNGLCATPPETLTPMDVDRLRTAGFVTDADFDFVPGLHLLGLGAYARSCLLARFPHQELAAVPFHMRWTIGIDEPPTVDEIRVYCERQEQKRQKSIAKGKESSFFDIIRPRVTKIWEKHSFEKYGLYGLKRLETPVTDEEILGCLAGNDFTYVNPKEPTVAEPKNLINYDSPALDTAHATVPSCTPLPVQIDLSANYNKSTQPPAKPTLIESVPNADSEAISESGGLGPQEAVENENIDTSLPRSTTPEIPTATVADPLLISVETNSIVTTRADSKIRSSENEDKSEEAIATSLSVDKDTPPSTSDDLVNDQSTKEPSDNQDTSDSEGSSLCLNEGKSILS